MNHSHCNIFSSLLLLTGIIPTAVAEQPPAADEVHLRFIGSDPGPPEDSVAVDETLAIALTGDRRFVLRISLAGPEALGGSSPLGIQFRAKAEMVEQSKAEVDGVSVWKDVANVEATEWAEVDLSIRAKAGTRLSLNGDSDTEGHSQKVAHKHLLVDLEVRLTENSHLVAEATAHWGDNSTDAEWKHEVKRAPARNVSEQSAADRPAAAAKSDCSVNQPDQPSQSTPLRP